MPCKWVKRTFMEAEVIRWYDTRQYVFDQKRLRVSRAQVIHCQMSNWLVSYMNIWKAHIWQSDRLDSQRQQITACSTWCISPIACNIPQKHLSTMSELGFIYSLTATDHEGALCIPPTCVLQDVWVDCTIGNVAWSSHTAWQQHVEHVNTESSQLTSPHGSPQHPQCSACVEACTVSSCCLLCRHNYTVCNSV